VVGRHVIVRDPARRGVRLAAPWLVDAPASGRGPELVRVKHAPRPACVAAFEVRDRKRTVGGGGEEKERRRTPGKKSGEGRRSQKGVIVPNAADLGLMGYAWVWVWVWCVAVPLTLIGKVLCERAELEPGRNLSSKARKKHVEGHPMCQPTS